MKQDKTMPEKERHENFMREMDEFEQKMDDDFRRINHLGDDADIDQILGVKQYEKEV